MMLRLFILNAKRLTSCPLLNRFLWQSTYIDVLESMGDALIDSVCTVLFTALFLSVSGHLLSYISSKNSRAFITRLGITKKPVRP